MHSDPTEANEIRRFEEQYAENPESFVFARLADAYRKAGNPARALEILETGLQRHPEYMSGHIVHARCLMDVERDEEAAAAWRRVLELDPQNLVALRQLAELSRAAGDRAAARVWAEKLLHVDPLNEDAARLVAETAPDDADVTPDTQAGDGEGELASRVAGVQPDDDEAFVDAGMLTETMADLYARQGLFEEAAEIYWELVKRHPADPKLREKLAEAQALASGEREGAPRVVRLEAAGGSEVSPVSSAVADVAGDTSADAEAMRDGRELPARSHSEKGQSRTPAAGIRNHLQALILGSASMEEAAGAPDRDGAADREAQDAPHGEGAASSFGEWLASRGR